jgi:single-strand DNA-binding protein
MPYCAFSIATRRSRMADGEWIATPHYFNFRLFGERWRGIGEHLKKGCLVSIQGHLEQYKWEQEGRKRSALKIAVERIGLLGKPERAGQEPDDLPDPALPESFETPEAGQENE